jgi:hypothetical protein
MNLSRILLFLIVTTLLLASAVQAQDKALLLNGTMIITLISRDTIWLGADSRTSALTNKGYTVNKQGMCKIYSTDNIIYAMAGHIRYVDNSFNFSDMMRTCIGEEKDFEKSMKVFEQRAKTEISSILKRFSSKSVNTLIETNNGSFLSVVAISFVDGERKIKELKFSIQAASKNNWNVIYRETNESGEGSLRFVGHAANASRFIKNNNMFFGNGKNIPGKLVELIELESANGTTTVGLPADVISIYNNGFKRVINSGLCINEYD